ncbi:SMC-Scp complex subunit ScpB [bacterium]|nr:SMC-Scp complex subunit ScpB [bacterium]
MTKKTEKPDSPDKTAEIVEMSPEKGFEDEESLEDDRQDFADDSDEGDPESVLPEEENGSPMVVIGTVKTGEEDQAKVLDLDLGDASEDEEEPESLESEIEDETARIEEAGGAEKFRTPGQIKAAIECLLFTTPHPLSLKKLKTLLDGIDIKTLRGIVSQLQMEYDARRGGLQVIENAEGYQMCTRADYADVVLRLHQQRKRNPLTLTALETLAIIAYKQPITRAEIEMIRGVESSGVVRNLCDMGLIKVVGRKEVIGRPQLYGTTSIFLNTFGLKTCADLPSIQALRRQYGERSTLADSIQEISSLDERIVTEENLREDPEGEDLAELEESEKLDEMAESPNGEGEAGAEESSSVDDIEPDLEDS